MENIVSVSLVVLVCVLTISIIIYFCEFKGRASCQVRLDKTAPTTYWNTERTRDNYDSKKLFVRQRSFFSTI